MRLSGLILKMLGWQVKITVPDYPKSIICVAPHTSNWDFILGKLAYASVGRKAGFLMKKEWFFFPLGPIFKMMGGIPVDRLKSGHAVERITSLFNSRKQMNLAITPEGTRKRTERWKTGFLAIALQANVPIVLGAFDFKSKTIYVERTFTPTGDFEADMRAIKDYYSQFTAKYPENFTTD